MPDEFPSAEFPSAELCGLPQRSDSSGRDHMEEIASDYLRRLRSGERLDLEAFAAQFPALSEELKEFLPMVAAMEEWKVQREFKAAQPPIPEQIEVTQLGEYRIIREIARGGMGVVFEAEQPNLNRRVAVKLLPWKFPKKSMLAEQFQREARTAAQLQHPNIVPVFSFGEQDERYFYAMQLIHGVGLDKLIQRWSRDHGIVSMDDLVAEYHPSGQQRAQERRSGSKRLLRHDSWLQLGKIATQIVSAIRYAHRSGTLHRDIKPGNLLIDLQGKVWITDFGLAMAQEKLLSESGGPLSGTLRYMAPEQFLRMGDERSDLYAFGATLYELCTLQPAFDGKTRSQLIEAIEKGNVTPPRAIKKEIPVQLERIILKCLSHDRDKRYYTCDQLYADLLRFLNTAESSRKTSWWQRLTGRG
ncbi:serine/threonine protein kinase [Planctomicrobium sp. SH661]|uniref:serine/threonine protein kinase n=1 Tax=Planctomicrobium sp. SH661 TaxID=3448124 RepID=UPI003F5CAD12